MKGRREQSLELECSKVLALFGKRVGILNSGFVKCTK